MIQNIKCNEFLIFQILLRISKFNHIIALIKKMNVPLNQIFESKLISFLLLFIII